ncbi:alpha/beta hydrolase family protein [Luteimonas kalidii]|uniref:Alpha/beta fold hydrolase n=1 Tax=Luteimonas kalidii TaxID=3042025 RepID=A0ABT6JT87_9GAMM|nr:alpha/beta fold hydrolase [Luteimonas kalidii]MDH5833905.1 alpha/beta fold hydrolase [Luteimonas kalidii]
MSPVVSTLETDVRADDGHRWRLLARVPQAPRQALLWLPALGVAARHYLAFADALAQRGVAVFVHEWRGHGSSDVRAGRGCDWGYRELLLHDLPASQAAARRLLLNNPPHLIGGHSLGGQLACCRLAMAPDTAAALWLVASGAPYWRSFPMPQRLLLPLAYRFLPWLARTRGALPGRRIGFGGNEAAGVIRDWARTALSGRYAAEGLDVDLEAAMSRVIRPVRAVLLAQDWLAPRGSLDFLLARMPAAPAQAICMDAHAAGTRADHYAWMKTPDAVVDRLLAQPGSA